MPPPSNHASLHLQVLPKAFFVVQLQPGDDIPPCMVKEVCHHSGRFFSITRTGDEISLVGESRSGMPDSVKEYSTWMCIKIIGPMEHGLTGIIAEFTAPLKSAKVPVFAVSTWNTDYVLVPTGMLPDAINALEKDGWVFDQGFKDGLVRL
ncbi:ACT domain-containing protein [Infundibulicybe gibba]|nr:ACT domain-containing protein [Infundibulicybe gibba]